MGQSGDGEPKKPDNDSNPRRSSPERALVISSVFVITCFLVHILILFLVQPFKVLPLSKLNAYAYSSIPLGMGIVFLLDAIANFRRIESRSFIHLFPFMLAVIFGGLSIQGLLGFIIYFIRHAA
jgi:hypothetical protein